MVANPRGRLPILGGGGGVANPGEGVGFNLFFSVISA